MAELSVSVVILTYNEEMNLDDCLESIKGWVKEIIIVDSYSTDKTLEIARKYTDRIYQHPFENQARQLNWASENIPIGSDWVLRLDADERVLPELRDELQKKLPDIGDDVSALYFKRRVHFMGKWMRRGGYYPTWLLRLWRKGRAVCEERWMDEHMIIREGKALFLESDIYEENMRDLHWWTEKHNSYAAREAIATFKGSTPPAEMPGGQTQRKRWLKENVYLKMPLFIRPFLYFIYRYFFRLGFLDGKEGLIWHFLQGFWYRFLVDAKIYEIKKKAKTEKKDAGAVIYELYGIKI